LRTIFISSRPEGKTRSVGVMVTCVLFSAPTTANWEGVVYIPGLCQLWRILLVGYDKMKCSLPNEWIGKTKKASAVLDAQLAAYTLILLSDTTRNDFRLIFPLSS
jgi:hypothetical protein